MERREFMRRPWTQHRAPYFLLYRGREGELGGGGCLTPVSPPPVCTWWVWVEERNPNLGRGDNAWHPVKRHARRCRARIILRGFSIFLFFCEEIPARSVWSGGETEYKHTGGGIIEESLSANKWLLRRWRKWNIADSSCCRGCEESTFFFWGEHSHREDGSFCEEAAPRKPTTGGSLPKPLSPAVEVSAGNFFLLFEKLLLSQWKRVKDIKEANKSWWKETFVVSSVEAGPFYPPGILHAARLEERKKERKKEKKKKSGCSLRVLDETLFVLSSTCFMLFALWCFHPKSVP